MRQLQSARKVRLARRVGVVKNLTQFDKSHFSVFLRFFSCFSASCFALFAVQNLATGAWGSDFAQKQKSLRFL